MIDWRGITSKDHLVLMKSAIDRMAEILNEPSVIRLYGDAYTDDDIDHLEKGRAALRSIIENPSQVQRLQNEQSVAVAGKAVETADRMLEREGFQEVKGEAWVDRDKRVIEIALGEYERAIAYRRN